MPYTVCFDGLKGKTCLNADKEVIKRMAERHKKEWNGRIPIQMSYELGMGFYFANFAPEEEFCACGYDTALCQECDRIDEYQRSIGILQRKE